jgi:hypothetical protein
MIFFNKEIRNYQISIVPFFNSGIFEVLSVQIFRKKKRVIFGLICFIPDLLFRILGVHQRLWHFGAQCGARKCHQHPWSFVNPLLELLLKTQQISLNTGSL